MICLFKITTGETVIGVLEGVETITKGIAREERAYVVSNPYVVNRHEGISGPWFPGVKNIHPVPFPFSAVMVYVEENEISESLLSLYRYGIL